MLLGLEAPGLLPLFSADTDKSQDCKSIVSLHSKYSTQFSASLYSIVVCVSTNCLHVPLAINTSFKRLLRFCVLKKGVSEVVFAVHCNYTS